MIDIMCLDKNYSITRLIVKNILDNEGWSGKPVKLFCKIDDENR